VITGRNTLTAPKAARRASLQSRIGISSPFPYLAGARCAGQPGSELTLRLTQKEN
jgi:hypothetical protein